MKTFLITLGLATLLIGLSAAGLAIGKILTGRSKFSCKRCGRPEKKDSCSICKKPQNSRHK